ncbi:hypothetical protein SEUCBS139899_005683 [Sporothrix eucalyptigena]|uniref:Uncharacterized protein n=1 Tax=Sporothrix eucalyptigena TaxID=1812306 RepID=A0ABP0AVW9_9PEZI
MPETHSSPPSSPSSSASGHNDQNKKSWSGAAYDTYNNLYESWVPWAEDIYLRYFTRHNKASYATEDTLSKTKVTGIKQVDTLQDGVHGVVSGQLGQGGLAQPVGDWVSREGVNRAERKGKDDKGEYLPSATPESLRNGAETVGSGVTSGVKSVGGAVGSLFGGGKKQ